MKPFRVWGTKLAALALLLVMATNALALPLHPIDDDPNSPPNPPVYVGDPSDSGGGYAKPLSTDLGSLFWIAFGNVLSLKLNTTVYLATRPIPTRAERVNLGAKSRCTR